MGFSKNTQATRSTLMSVDSTLSENITAAQNYIPIASTTNFSTGIVAEIETTNEVVSFTDISSNIGLYSQVLELRQLVRGRRQADLLSHKMLWSHLMELPQQLNVYNKVDKLLLVRIIDLSL